MGWKKVKLLHMYRHCDTCMEDLLPEMLAHAEVDKKVREAAGIVQKANSQGLVEGRVPPPRSLAAGPAPAPAPHAEARSGKPPQSTRV